MSAPAATEMPARYSGKVKPHIERQVVVNGTALRYIEGGIDNPGPPLVLLHGFQSGADLWYPHTFPAFATERHVIAVDLPGFAYSGPLDAYTIQAYAHFLHAFIDAQGYDRIDLLGHSMGGQVAAATAAERPDRVRKLVLVASAGLPRTDSLLSDLTMLLDRSTFHLRLIPTVARLALKARARRACVRMIREESIHGLLSNLTMPALVLWGSRDRVVPLEHATLFARAIPHARLYIMRGCGHMPFYQKHLQFEKVVLQFLAT